MDSAFLGDSFQMGQLVVDDVQRASQSEESGDEEAIRPMFIEGEERKDDELLGQAEQEESSRQELLFQNSTHPVSAEDTEPEGLLTQSNSDTYTDSYRTESQSGDLIPFASILGNYWLQGWITYLAYLGVYITFLSCIYLALVYVSLELLYIFTNRG
ncbi:uncharacterized protein LOC131939654 [Physella acuta]|uniref:uncharacterized protein LOC131939654 n=1 Tax=Physella acuta TaxID=109671 RepID=UPI0027DD5009|nr:uncharacterized protein LOC131939654 [Physella acuta]